MNVINECEICFEVKTVYGRCMDNTCARGVCRECFIVYNKHICPFCKRSHKFRMIYSKAVAEEVRDSIIDINTVIYEQGYMA